ncbi:MAG TPA: type II toxin-antitoxin system VapC family toxin [Jiangellales bacterium]|nr:type II toxin-antitoxin system VapC family toxin [Jiangellales bacterium]
MSFADSSALVKLYADEPGHEVVRAHSPLVVSQLCRVEVPAALWRKQRMGEITPQQAGDLVAEFEADYFGADSERGQFIVVAVSAEILDSAARAVATHALRAYDAVQLASALLAGEAAPEVAKLLAWDARLCETAAQEGFTTYPE